MSSRPETEPVAGEDAATPAVKTWFDHMTGYLKWKVIGPDINNPFKTPIPFHVLNRMANQRDFLSQYIQIRCMCDGYEVMIIINPNQPRIVSNHPCISGMDRGEIVDYVRRSGLDEFIDDEIDRIEKEIQEHLTSRNRESDEESTTYLDGKKNRSGTSSKGNKDDSRSKNFRIVKR